MVEAACVQSDDADRLHAVTTVPLLHDGGDGSRHWSTGTVPLTLTLTLTGLGVVVTA